MATPETHALLSASSAEKWMHCPAAARLEASLPEQTSSYAEEGRLAHAIGELKARRKFVEPMGPKKYSNALKKLKTDPLYKPEMDSCTEAYLDYITEIAMTYASKPHVAVERKVDLSLYIPEGFGTCDCIIIGGNKLHIVDYKHGCGVPVSADHNPQMMLYALGALSAYQMLYDIQSVTMSIVQPRIDNYSSFTLARDDLLDWGVFKVRPAAKTAFEGDGKYVPGHWCDDHFCRARATCRARAEKYISLEADKGKLPPLITDDEAGELLARAQGLQKWAAQLESYALDRILAGGTVSGWKAVAGRSNRVLTDTDAVVSCLRDVHGYDEALLYTRNPLTLTGFETLAGKKNFAEWCAPYIAKPQGKPTLVPITDKRDPYQPHTAASDFADIVNN